MQTIRKHARGRWYECRPAANGFWYIHWSEGRRSCRASTRKKTLAEAQAFFDEWLTMEATEAEFNAVPTVAELWTAKYGGDMPDRVEAAWRHLEPVFGHLRPAQVTDRLERQYGKDRGVAPSTLRLELSLLRSVWNHAVKKRTLSINDTPALGPLPEQSPPRDRWLSAEETARVLAAAPEMSRVWRFIWIASETAARRTAIQDLRWSQVDFEVGVIHFLPPGAKQSRKRKASVPISSRLRPVLERMHEARTDEWVIGGGGKINEALRAVGTRAKVDGVTPHVFRHTAATRMAREGVPLWIIANILGNTVEQVEKVYAKYQPEMARAAIDMISKGMAA